MRWCMPITIERFSVSSRAGGLAGRGAARLGRGHAAALFGATAAGLGAFAAVLHGGVLLAFLRARFADIGAGFADHSGKLAAASHVADRKATDCSTVEVKLDAACKHLDVLLPQAGRGTMVAGEGAGVAGVNAGLELLVWHRSSENPARRKKWSRRRNPATVYASNCCGRIPN